MKRLMTVILLVTLALTVGACDNNSTLPTTPTNTPVISLFSADSVKFSLLGQGVTNLHWEVLDTKAMVRIDPLPGNVPYVGSAQFAPAAVGTYNFTLTATNANGTTQRFITIVVGP